MNPYVLDKPAILERLGGDEDIFAMMVDMFLNEQDNNRQALLAALAADSAALQREAHTIKGLLATFSDGLGAELAQALEYQAKSGLVDDAQARVTELLARVDEVAGVLRGLSAG
ncbi:MAG: Hpt domain-containing protein [Dechloromonas sp.]|jgi:HPt (histidine-containing phosphotransfer) domain-containing protein|uniref:Hpt domain-containing protein n=1 Tax=Azonexus hydrophilus TaxID=418702 RepID=A0ABZ2XKD7_9RHOO|nr:Hpt domain-containing protein [Azonexus hydrophilus]MBS4020671.1 Hpt domain-containing protein [Dechloromonas sp.]MCA1937269.1 Hpt domain-containing protein [Dechloromonas sp.]